MLFKIPLKWKTKNRTKNEKQKTNMWCNLYLVISAAFDYFKTFVNVFDRKHQTLSFVLYGFKHCLFKSKTRDIVVLKRKKLTFLIRERFRMVWSSCWSIQRSLSTDKFLLPYMEFSYKYVYLRKTVSDLKKCDVSIWWE